MFSYYTAIIMMSWMALGVLCILIHENGRIPRADKRLFYTTYLLIAVSALAEWCGVRLDGNADVPAWILRLMKCADYTLTPMAGGALVMQMHMRNRWQKALQGILVANTAFQLFSLFNDWMIRIDDQHHYTHGPLYAFYLGVCLAIISIVLIQFVIYGKSFRRQNRKSLYLIMLMVIAGIVVQEILPVGHRTAYIGLTLGAAMMFIHYSEFSQMASDEQMMQQQIKIDTDALTGVFSRMAYSDTLKRLNAAGDLPESFAAFTIDINGLKDVNDRLGHDAGDELICGAARCIEAAFHEAARCYRTGGDEFVVLAEDMDSIQASAALDHLARETEQWRGDKIERLMLASGCALAKDHPGLSAEALVRKADLAMYEAKAEYYRMTGIDRRHSRS